MSKTIELGLPEYEADDTLKSQFTHNIMAIHIAIQGMEGTYSPNVQYLVDCAITSVTPYAKQEALFELKETLIKEAIGGITSTDLKNEKIMDVNMRILGLVREHFAHRYSEKRLSIMV